MPFEVGLSGSQEGQKTKVYNLDKKMCSHHVGVKRVDDAGIHGDDGTKR